MKRIAKELFYSRRIPFPDEGVFNRQACSIFPVYNLLRNLILVYVLYFDVSVFVITSLLLCLLAFVLLCFSYFLCFRFFAALPFWFLFCLMVKLWFDMTGYFSGTIVMNLKRMIYLAKRFVSRLHLQSYSPFLESFKHIYVYLDWISIGVLKIQLGERTC